MRIETPRHHERFGDVRIHELTRVVELDAGLDGDHSHVEADVGGVSHVAASAIGDVERRMAIVVPIKDERLDVIDGVLSGIPHDCLIIAVSASRRDPDRYRLETELAERFCSAAARPMVLIHQDDPGLAATLVSCGFGEIVEGATVRGGKGEAMVVGMLLAELEGKDYVGFVDADNYVPGAVHEYVKVFAAGLHLAPSPYAMVRVSWRSKPKIEDGALVFNRWGRTTQVTNRFLNLVLSTVTGSGTDPITTGNAGEHAMTLALARRLRFAGGFSVEPFEYVELFEQFGGVVDPAYPNPDRAPVDVYQVETRNPHFHEDKGDEHVLGMQVQALNVVCHSPMCPPEVREEIVDFLTEQRALTPGERPPPARVYPPYRRIDLAEFAETLSMKSESLRRLPAAE